MHTGYWALPLTFLGVSIPAILLMHRFDFGGDSKVLLALGLGVLATLFMQTRLAKWAAQQQRAGASAAAPAQRKETRP